MNPKNTFIKIIEYTLVTIYKYLLRVNKDKIKVLNYLSLSLAMLIIFNLISLGLPLLYCFQLNDHYIIYFIILGFILIVSIRILLIKTDILNKSLNKVKNDDIELHTKYKRISLIYMLVSLIVFTIIQYFILNKIW